MAGLVTAKAALQLRKQAHVRHKSLLMEMSCTLYAACSWVLLAFGNLCLT